MAYFSVMGDYYPLEMVSNVLKIDPTETHKKGNVIERDNPELEAIKIRRKETSWTLSTGYQDSYGMTNSHCKDKRINR